MRIFSINVQELLKRFCNGTYIIPADLPEIDRLFDLDKHNNSSEYFKKHFSNKSAIRFVGIISISDDESHQEFIIDGVSRLQALRNCFENELLDELILSQPVPILLIDGLEKSRDEFSHKGERPTWHYYRRELNSTRFHIEEALEIQYEGLEEEYQDKISKLYDEIDKLKEEIQNLEGKKKR